MTKPFDEEHNRNALLALHEEGIELTPEQLTKLRKEFLSEIRENLKRKGLGPPKSDEDLFLIIYEVMQALKGIKIYD